jgi:two-component system sensor kinase FixL
MSGEAAFDLQAELDHLYATAPVGLCSLDEQLCYVRVNERLAEIHGCAVEDLLGREMIPDMAQTLAPILRQVLETGKATENIEVRAMTPAFPDAPRDWLCSCSPLKSKDGVVQGISLVVQDITQSKQVEEQLRAWDAKHRGLLAAVPDMMFRVRVDGTIMEFVPAGDFEPLLPPEEFIAKKVHDVMPPQLADQIMEDLGQAIRTGAVQEHEYALPEEGGPHYYEYRMAPCADDEVLSIVRDINKRKQAEKALRESNEDLEARVQARTRALRESNVALLAEVAERRRAEEAVVRGQRWFGQMIESAPDAIVLIKESGSIVLVNEQTERLFGYSREELIDQDLEMLLPTRFRGKHTEKRAEYFSHPRPRPMGQGDALAGLRRDGSEFPVEISLTPLETDEGLLVSGTIRDLTRQKKAEAEVRRHREDLAHVTRFATMGELAASLAHELNQPLSAMVTNAQAAVRLLANNPAGIEDVNEALRDIASDGRRAGGVIHGLRKLLRRGERDSVALDVNELVREVLLLLHSEAIERKIAIIHELAPELPAVHGDRIQLQQVLLNLILNGFEAMSESKGDRRLVVATTADGSDTIEIAVRDSGVGLERDDIDHLLDAFVTSKPGGMGMGLTINRSIVEAHGGQLGGKRNPDGGATFFFTIPVAADAAQGGG